MVGGAGGLGTAERIGGSAPESEEGLSSVASPALAARVAPSLTPARESLAPHLEAVGRLKAGTPRRTGLAHPVPRSERSPGPEHLPAILGGAVLLLGAGGLFGWRRYRVRH